jgi:hypothetical protein
MEAIADITEETLAFASSSKYHKFLFIFDRSSAQALLSYHLFDYAINLKDVEPLPCSTNYTLSELEFNELEEYLPDMLHIENILPAKY